MTRQASWIVDDDDIIYIMVEYTRVYVYDRPDICHRYHRLYLWRKICHEEKFQLSVENLNNLWSFIKIYAVFVLNLCGEKSVWRKSVWRKNGKYEVAV